MPALHYVANMSEFLVSSHLHWFWICVHTIEPWYIDTHLYFFFKIIEIEQNQKKNYPFCLMKCSQSSDYLKKKFHIIKLNSNKIFQNYILDINQSREKRFSSLSLIRKLSKGTLSSCFLIAGGGRIFLICSTTLCSHGLKRVRTSTLNITVQYVGIFIQ